YLGTGPRGEYLLDVDDYRERPALKVIRRALVRYDPSGKRSVAPLPREWSTALYASSARDSILIGRDGSIWFENGKRFKDGVIDQPLPEWLGRQAKQIDRDGHLFCGSSTVINLNARPSDEKARINSKPPDQ